MEQMIPQIQTVIYITIYIQQIEILKRIHGTVQINSLMNIKNVVCTAHKSSLSAPYDIHPPIFPEVYLYFHGSQVEQHCK